MPGLNARYRGNENDKHLFRSLQALAFVPVNEVYRFLCIIMDALMGPPEMEILGKLVKNFNSIIFKDLLKYFILTYIGPAYVITQPQIQPDEAGGGNDDWVRAWIEHEGMQQRNSLYPIEVFL